MLSHVCASPFASLFLFRSHQCDFSTWDIVVARDDLINQQMERINMRPVDSKGAQPRMKSLVVSVVRMSFNPDLIALQLRERESQHYHRHLDQGVYRKGAGARTVNKKEDLPKRSRRRRKWEADDADSLPTSVGIEGDEEGGGDSDEEGEPSAHGGAREEKKQGGGGGKEADDGDDDDGLTREEKAERRRLANERRERGEKRKADELIKKKTQDSKELSKQDKQFLKQQLKKDKRQQRREKKLEKTRRGNTTTEAD
jgi:hypothetical protein